MKVNKRIFGLPLVGVVDTDWARDALDRRSYSGYAFISAGSVVSWEARKQPTVALSEATKQAMYCIYKVFHEI